MNFIQLFAGGQGAQGGGLLAYLPFILILLIMYFLMIRPQAKRQKEKKRMLEELKKKDLVIVPELNYQGQFSSILRSMGVKAESITQYTGLPFKGRTLVEKITEMTNAHLKETVRV